MVTVSLKGSSWVASNEYWCRCGSLYWFETDWRSDNRGFRPTMNPHEPRIELRGGSWFDRPEFANKNVFIATGVPERWKWDVGRGFRLQKVCG